MNKKDIELEIKKNNINPGECCFLDISSLVIRGIIDECEKIDIAVKMKDFEKKTSENIKKVMMDEKKIQYEIIEGYLLEKIEPIKERFEKANMREICEKIDEYQKNMKHEICAGCYVIDDGKVLLIRHNKGHWDFPKGHMEPCETLEKTAKREVFEETGIKVEIISDKQYEISYKPAMNIQKRVVFFEARNIGGKLKNQEEEIQDLGWFEFDEAVSKITYDLSRNKFQEFLNERSNVIDSDK